MTKLETQRDFYETVYYRGRLGARKPSGHLRRLARRIEIRPGEDVLDIGCGTGQWLQACMEGGARPSGIDLSEKAIGVCKDRMPKGVFRAECADLLPFGDESFDVITSMALAFA